MSTPESAEHGVTFDLATIAQELRNEEPYVREGHTARTLLRASDLRVVLIAVRAGSTISEHHANVTAAVHVLSGRIRLQLPDRAVELEAGQLLVLGPGLAHDVHAQTDGAFLLTLGWRTGQ
ncbi:MAG: cupin domain-containing protein [Deltaproteobacteria bacterium]|nr:cupin domain-containing protein [Deltaproteobacteria bacterium]